MKMHDRPESTTTSPTNEGEKKINGLCMASVGLVARASYSLAKALKRTVDRQIMQSISLLCMPL